MSDTYLFMSSNKVPKLIGVFLLMMVFFSFPIISLFEKDQLVFGIPALFAYIFFVWLLLIIFILRITWTKKNKK